MIALTELTDMFTHAHPDPVVKQPLPFLASLVLQFALLAALSYLPLPQMSGPRIRSHHANSSPVTPIYFRPDAVAAPSVPPPGVAAPEPAPTPVQPAPPPSVANASATTADTSADAGSATADDQGWSMMDSVPGDDFAAMHQQMHHMMTVATPVFAPEPPIMHAEIPAPARGKDVVMEVLIDQQGAIVEAQVLQGVGYGLESTIMETLWKWVFVPAKVNGVAVTSRRQIVFHFPPG